MEFAGCLKHKITFCAYRLSVPKAMASNLFYVIIYLKNYLIMGLILVDYCLQPLFMPVLSRV